MVSQSRIASSASNKSVSTPGSNHGKRSSNVSKSMNRSGSQLDDSQVDSSISDVPGTNLSQGAIFSIRRKKKRNLLNSQAEEDPTSHELTFTVTVSQAVPTEELERLNPTAAAGIEREATDSSMNKRKKASEAPKPLQYFHYSYHLIPPEEGDEESAADVVTFSNAAKVYGKGAISSDNPGVKTWREGDKTWFAFQHLHKISVTKELLHKLFNHTLDLRVWNTKDKVNATTRFDRPKAFRFPFPKPGEDLEDIGGVRPVVTNQSRDFMSLQPKRYFSNRDEAFYSRRKDIYRLLPHERIELEHKFAELAETNPDLVPKPPRNETTDGKENASPNGEGKPLEESVYNMGGSRGESPSGKIPHTIVGYQRSGDLTDEENLRTYSRLGRLAAASDRLDKPIAMGGRTQSIAGSSKAGLDNRRGSAMSRVSRRSTVVGGGLKKGGGTGVGATSQERALDEKEAQYNKYGVAAVSVRMSMLFAGLRSVTNRLDHPVEDVSDMFVTISLDDDLLNEQQREALNPMSIKIESTTSMPATPLSFNELRKKCHPAYCKYKFGNLDWYKTAPKIQDKDIQWNDTNVVLLGTMEPAEVREIFRDGLFEIQIHDRDRKKMKQEKPAALFGEEPDDDKISSIALVANKRTMHNAFESKSTWDPYGVARIDLCDLLKGHKRLSVKVQVQQGPLPDLLGLQSMTSDGAKSRYDAPKVVGNPASLDGPVELPLPAGSYLESGCSIKLTVEVTRLLVTPDEVVRNEILPHSSKCPFTRLVLMCGDEDQGLLVPVFAKIKEINSKALQLDYLPETSIQPALKTYRLSDEQKQSGDCDIITGVHILDGKFHLVLLEGVRSAGINELWHSLPRPNDDTQRLTMIFDSDLMFSKREYSYFGASMYRIRIHEPLASIMIQPLLYVRDMVPKDSFDCLCKIFQLIQSKDMKDIVRNRLFPTVDMIKSMSKEFGIAYFQEPTNVPPAAESSPDRSRRKKKKATAESRLAQQQHPTPTSHELADFDDVTSSDMQKSSFRPMAHGAGVFGSRAWTPLLLQNPEYEMLLKERKEHPEQKDYHAQNKELVEKLSQTSRLRKDIPHEFSTPLRSKESSLVHNYSTQTENSTEISLNRLRDFLNTRYPGRLFTYMKDDYWNSGVFVCVDVDEVKKREERPDKSKWMSESGFVYPGVDSAAENHKHSRQPNQLRLEELRSFVWKENVLHEGQLRATLPHRDVFKWQFRREDTDLKTKAQPFFGLKFPETIMLSGDTKLAEERAAYDARMKEWREKLGGRNPVWSFHRLNPQTELVERGAKSSNQLDKLTGMLKIDPGSHEMMTKLNCHVPPLGVVHYPSVDKRARDAGFDPPAGLAQTTEDTAEPPYTLGDDEDKGINRNSISLTGTSRSLKIDPTQTDFRLINPTRSYRSFRKIDKLDEQETSNYLFDQLHKEENGPQVQRESLSHLVPAN